MVDQASDHQEGRGIRAALRRGTGVLALALLALAVPLLPDGPGRLAVWSVAVTLVVTFLLADAAGLVQRWRRQRLLGQLNRLLTNDPTPCFATDDLGRLLYLNRAAVARGGATTSLTAALEDLVAHPAAMLYRLQGCAVRDGQAREDVVTRRGVLRTTVQRGRPGHFIWRFEEFLDRGPSARGGDGISLPMLVAGRGGAVLFANEAIRRLLGERPRALDRVFSQLPVQSGQTVILAAAAGRVEAVVLEIAGPAERREIYLLPVAALPRPPTPHPDEDLPVALIRLAASGNVLSANGTACDLLGIGPDTLINASDLFEGLGRPVRDWIADVAAGRLPGKTEVLRLSRSGPETFVQITLRPLSDGPQADLIAVVSDATAMKTLEAQFVQSQKMQAIGQLAGGVAHDFNNLLTAISGHCDLLLLNHDPTDPDYADLAQIHQNANRAADLVGQLLAFSRKQTLRPAQLHLDEVLGDVTHLLKRLVGERIRLEFVHEEGLAPIRADRRQLEQVLVNLVVNARHAMPEGGSIRIETQSSHLGVPLTLDRVMIPAGDYVLVRVTDHGCGIPPELLDKVFEPFFTTKRPGEGTGLGLSTAYGIVKQSGGYIFVESEPGRGACFTLYFPQHSEAEEADPPTLADPPVSAQGFGGAVLLVEDEAPVRAFAARALGLRGFTVVEAESGEAALELLSDPAVHVDVLVTDVIMPGMDGPTWVRAALRDRPHLRVVFISGYAEEGFAGAQDDMPESVFLPKPFSLEELTRTVSAQIGRLQPRTLS